MGDRIHTDNENLPADTFTFYSDPTGGWLFVPWSVVYKLRLDVMSFSSYCYADMDGVYLTENDDLESFEQEYKAIMGRRVVFWDEWDGECSPVRSKDPLHDFPWEYIISDLANGFSA